MKISREPERLSKGFPFVVGELPLVYGQGGGGGKVKSKREGDMQRDFSRETLKVFFLLFLIPRSACRFLFD